MADQSYLFNWFSLQPQIYRSIIDDVIANIQVDFEEYGMEEEILINLQGVGFDAEQRNQRLTVLCRNGKPSSSRHAWPTSPEPPM